MKEKKFPGKSSQLPSKFYAMVMPPKILNYIFGRPKMFCKKLEKNERMG